MRLHSKARKLPILSSKALTKKASLVQCICYQQTDKIKTLYFKWQCSKAFSAVVRSYFSLDYEDANVNNYPNILISETKPWKIRRPAN